MRKFDIKSVALGFIIGTIGITTVFAAGGITSATFSDTKVMLDGNFVPLTKPLISIVQDSENDASLYMPIRELLEYMGYTVSWDGSQNSVNLVSNFSEEIRLGKYVTDEGFAWVYLQDNNEFVFNRHDVTSYRPTGSYSIKNGKLTLHVTDAEEYLFEINDNQLIFLSGEPAESLVDAGTIFKYISQ